MSYQVDRFLAAVSVLAGHGHIKQRLMKAYEDHLVDINDDELPRALKEQFAELKQQMYRVTPLNGEGPICASVRKMSIDEASDCAAMVVGLYDELARRRQVVDAALPGDGQDRVNVPPFLIKSN